MSSTLVEGILLALFVAALAAVSGLYIRVRNLERDLAITMTKIGPFWLQLQSKISKDLHHPSPRYFEMDKLLESLEAKRITPRETERLKALLRLRAEDHHGDITPSQRSSALLMLGVMDKVLEESGNKP